MDSYEFLEYSVRDGYAEIRLNRPDVLNACNREMLHELNSAIDGALTDSAVAVLVLTGNGRGFCSGADVSNMEGRSDRDDPLTYRQHLGTIQNIVRQLYMGPKPTIAAVNGPAVGIGCDFALACDLRIMSENAMLREQFVNIGIVPGDGGAWLLPRLIGESKAKEYLLTGKSITPESALDDGLVMDVTEDGNTLDRTREIALDIVAKPQQGVRGTKAIIDVNQSFEAHTQLAFEEQWKCINDPEHYEAVNALIEGREPDFNRDQ